LRDDVARVAGLVDTLAFLEEVVLPVVFEVAVAAKGAELIRMAPAPLSPQRAPVRSIRSLTRWRQAPSMTPVAIGQPWASVVG